MFSYDLEKLTLPKAARAVSAVFVLLIAPNWYVFQFQRSLYDKADLVKLIIMGSGIAFPVLAMNFALVITEKALKNELIEPNERKGKNEVLEQNVSQTTKEISDAIFWDLFDTALVSSVLVFYVPIIMYFFLPIKTIKEAIWYSFSAAVGVHGSIITHLLTLRRRRRLKRQMQKKQ